MKEDEKWIKAFKDKLEDYSEPMPASGWERLERELMPVTEKRIYPYRRWAVPHGGHGTIRAATHAKQYTFI